MTIISRTYKQLEITKKFCSKDWLNQKNKYNNIGVIICTIILKEQLQLLKIIQ